MLNFLARRLAHAILVLVAVVFVVSMIVKLVPGDVVDVMAVGNPGFTEQDAVRLREKLGVNKPVFVQFATYAVHAVQGDFGVSIRHKRPVVDLIAERIGPTLELTLFSMIVALILAIPLGVLTALRQGSVLDYGGTVFAILGVAVPGFLVGILLILVFTVELRWLPPAGRKDSAFVALYQAVVAGDAGIFWDSARFYVLPSVSLAIGAMAINVRLTRSTMLEVIRQDYIQFAKAKGLPTRVIYIRHALRNALIPTITVIGLQLGFLMSGVFIIENVFAWPGLGRLAVQAISWRDFPLIQATVLVSAVFFVVLNILIDIVYKLVDPRITNVGS